MTVRTCGLSLKEKLGGGELCGLWTQTELEQLLESSSMI